MDGHMEVLQVALTCSTLSPFIHVYQPRCLMPDFRRNWIDHQPESHDVVCFRWLFGYLGISGKPVAPTAILVYGMVLASVVSIVWILSR